MNPQRDRGIRAEREACVLLSGLLDLDIRRRANEGVREDISDLIGLPDTAIQVSACHEPLPRCASSAADLLRFAFCRHCGGSWQLDDTDGLATHEATCATRTLRQRSNP